MQDDHHPDSPEPRWRIRQSQQRGWRRWFDRTLVQADVIAPNGEHYLVRVSRNLPVRKSPLGPLDNLVPQHVSLGVLVAANAYTRGRTGWSVSVLRPQTRWRSARVIFIDGVRDAALVADRAMALVDAIRNGYRPWEERKGLIEKYFR